MQSGGIIRRVRAAMMRMGWLDDHHLGGGHVSSPLVSQNVCICRAVINNRLRLRTGILLIFTLRWTEEATDGHMDRRG